MSVARTYSVKKTRKVWTCTKCREEIPKGSPAINFAVGFRGRTQYRHDTPQCRPKTSELESSAVATVYAAMEEADVEGVDSLEDLEQVVQDVVEALEEVQSEYENNEMFEINEDLQERASVLEQAADTLGSWADGLDSEPEADDYHGPESESRYEEDHEAWLSEAKETAQEAINNIELP